MFCCSNNKPQKRKPQTQSQIQNESFDKSINNEQELWQMSDPVDLPQKLVNSSQLPKFFGATTESESRIKDQKLVQHVRTITKRGMNAFQKFEAFKLVQLNCDTEFIGAKEQYTLLINKIE